MELRGLWLSIGMLVPALAFGFSDITIADPYYPSTTYLEQAEVFKGYDDGSFGRNKLINRAEALKTIFTAAETDTSTKPAGGKAFSDVPEGVWFAPFVDYASAQGIVKGDGGGDIFAPARTVNKAEFLKMLMKAFEVDPTGYDLSEVVIADVPNDAWFAPYFQFAVKFEILVPNGQNQVDPGAELTRGEVSELIFSMLRAGKGLDVQVLLNLTELHLIKALELIEASESVSAALVTGVGRNYAEIADELLPENAVVESAVEISVAMSHIVRAYEYQLDQNYEAVIASSKEAWNAADKSQKLNPANDVLSTKIKLIVEKMAASSREHLGQ